MNVEKAETEFWKMVDLAGCSRVHSCKYEGDKLPTERLRGVFVVVVDHDSNISLLLDGNHRVNTYEFQYLEKERDFEVIVIEGFVNKKMVK